MRTLIAAATAACALAACASKPPQEVRLKFDPEAHRAWMVEGDNEIRGQAFLRQPDQSTITCAGTAVIAAPATAYFRQVLRLAANGQMPLVGDAVGRDHADIVHRSVCDKDGNFSIKDVPPGDWLVASSVNWTVRNLTSGGLVVYKVRLRSKEIAQIVMTERDLGIPR